MKKYLSKERVLLIFTVCILLLSLVSCRSADNYSLPLNEWSEENFFGKILTWPIAWVMHLIGSIFPSGQFAWGILFTTIIVRTIAWPIYAKSNDMSLKMAVAQPDIQRVQMKYANRKDPQSQQRMQQELMAVYKKHKINFLGCFMPFVQMPIFMAMYEVVRRMPVVTETITNPKLALTDASFLGIENCLNIGVYGSTGETAALWSAPFWVGIALAALVGGTMWLLNYFSQKKPSYQKNTSTHNQQPANDMAKSMKIMQYFMIVMMVVASLSNNGLALYWVVGNIYSIGQGFVNRFLNEKKYYKMKQENSIDNLI